MNSGLPVPNTDAVRGFAELARCIWTELQCDHAVLAGDVGDSVITTIEGLGSAEHLHPVQQARFDEDVPQCGYCQPGQMMSAAALLLENPAPTDDDITTAMDGNICRCGTYGRIRRAIHRAAATLENRGKQ